MTRLRRIGVEGLLATQLVDSFFHQRSELIERFLYGMEDDRYEATVSNFERAKFLTHRGRMPTDPGTQVVGAIRHFPNLPAECGLAVRAAAALDAVLRLLEQEATGKHTSGIADLFSLSRRFNEPVDRVLANDDSDVIVLYEGRCFLLRVMENGKAAGFPALHRVLKEILRLAREMPPTSLPVVTALPKGEAVRELELARKARPQLLERLERAFFCLALTGPHPRRGGAPDQFAGLTGLGGDRWFGKTTLVVDPLGHVGAYGDHALADGMVMMRFAERWAAGFLRHRGAAPGAKSGRDARALEIRAIPPFDAAAEARWSRHRSDYRAHLAALSSAQFSLEVPRPQRAHLAAAVPLAGQAARYALRGELEAAYLPVSQRALASRGLDFVHGSAPGTAELLRRLHLAGREELSALHDILSWWAKSVRAVVKGSSGERRLHYLYQEAARQGAERDSFFTAAGFPDCLAYPKLCLSVLDGDRGLPGTAFVPVDDGWSLGVTLHQEGLNATLLAWKGEAETAADACRRSLSRILELAAEAHPPGRTGQRQVAPAH